MSSWIVTKAHVDAMVQSMINEGMIVDQDPTTIGKMLWTENWFAFNYRYDGRYPDERPDIEGYVFEGTDKPLDPVGIASLIRCYHYQCSEHAECDKQPGWQLLEFLKGVLGVSETERGPWGIDSIEEVTLVDKDEEEIYTVADALSEPWVLSDVPQTPSLLARKAKVTTRQAHRALRWMAEHHYVVAVGSGTRTRYRTRRAGEATQ